MLGRVWGLWRTPTMLHMVFPMLLWCFGFGLLNPALQILMLDVACTRLSMEACDSAAVAGYAARWMMWVGVATSIVPVFAAGTLGTLSDRYGRRLTLALPCVGLLVQCAVILIFWYMEKPIWWLVMASALASVTGGSGTMFCGMFSYVADVSTAQRTLYFACLAALQYFAVALSNVLLGPIVNAYGVIGPFLVVGSSTVALTLYVLMVPESLTADKRVASLDWRRVNILGALEGLFRPSRIGKPRALVTLAITFAFAYCGFIAFVMVLVLYATQLFGWDTNMIGDFAATESAARGFGVLVIAPLLFWSHESLFSTSTVISLSLIFQTAAYGVYSVARTTRVMYLGVILEGISAVSIPTIRSVFSRAVPVTEQGKVLSAISAIETIINVVIPIFIPWFFSQTNVQCPRCSLYVVVGVSFLGFLASLIYTCCSIPLPAADLSEEDQDDAIPRPPKDTETPATRGPYQKLVNADPKTDYAHPLPSSPLVTGDNCPYIQMHAGQEPSHIAAHGGPRYGAIGQVP